MPVAGLSSGERDRVAPAAQRGVKEPTKRAAKALAIFVSDASPGAAGATRSPLTVAIHGCLRCGLRHRRPPGLMGRGCGPRVGA